MPVAKTASPVGRDIEASAHFVALHIDDAKIRSGIPRLCWSGIKSPYPRPWRARYLSTNQPIHLFRRNCDNPNENSLH